MRLLEFSATGWRNLEPLQWTPGSGVNVLHGDNAQGKTNLLEAVYYVSTLRSFRVARPSQMITWGKERLRVTTRAEVAGVSTTLEVRQSTSGRELFVDGAPVEATEDYFGGFNVVLFTPEHLNLVRGEPAMRRQFMDRALFHVESSQLRLVRRYQRILRERNACLRRGLTHPRRTDALLDAVDPQLAEVGAHLAVRRQQLLGELTERFREFHGRISGGDKEVALRYRARGLTRSKEASSEATEGAAEWETEDLGELTGETDAPPLPSEEEQAITLHRDRLAQALATRREEDKRRGFTGVGPHQDDLDLRLDGRSARQSASQGEARTLVLALKLAEVEYVRERRSEMPVLLLDDLGSELDEKRRRELLEHVLALGGQSFLTTVVPESLCGAEKGVYFKIDKGTITPTPAPSFPGVQGGGDRL